MIAPLYLPKFCESMTAYEPAVVTCAMVVESPARYVVLMTPVNKGGETIRSFSMGILENVHALPNQNINCRADLELTS